VRWLVLFTYLGFLTWASLVPAEALGWFPLRFPYADKLVHFLIYGGLVAVARWALAPRASRPPRSNASMVQSVNPSLPSPLAPSVPPCGKSSFSLLLSALPSASLLLAAIAYGGLIELLQSLIVSYGRSFEVLDLLANTLGALCFWWLTNPWFRSPPK
jgi:hypothetical protein